MNTIDTLLELKGDIAEIKEDVREATGAFKYDFAYDDCLKLIDDRIAQIETIPDMETAEMAAHLSHMMGYPIEEILKYMKGENK